jgi:hypothetical protein
MTGELVKQILSSSVVAAMIVSMIGGGWKIVQDKRRNARIDDRDVGDRLNDMLAAAEDHIVNYDVPMRERVMQHEALINQLRMSNNQAPVAFPPMPEAAPLFPRRAK